MACGCGCCCAGRYCESACRFRHVYPTFVTPLSDCHSWIAKSLTIVDRLSTWIKIWIWEEEDKERVKGKILDIIERAWFGHELETTSHLLARIGMEKARLELVSSINPLYLEQASHEFAKTRSIPAREHPLAVPNLDILLISFQLAIQSFYCIVICHRGLRL